MRYEIKNLTESERWLIEENLIIKKCREYCIEQNIPFNFCKNKDGLFFIFGLDKESVMNPDVEKMKERSSKNRDMFFTDSLYLRIDKQSPFCSAKTIIHTIQGLNFIRTNFSKRGMEIPESVPLIHLVNWYGAAGYRDGLVKKNLEASLKRDTEDLSTDMDLYSKKNKAG